MFCPLDSLMSRAPAGSVMMRRNHHYFQAVLRKWVPSAKFGTWQTGLAPGKIFLAPGNFQSFKKVSLAPGKFVQSAQKLHHFKPKFQKFSGGDPPIPAFTDIFIPQVVPKHDTRCLTSYPFIIFVQHIV